VLNGQLFVVGGVCGPLALSEVEKYDPDTNTWSRSPPMQVRVGVVDGGIMRFLTGVSYSGWPVGLWCGCAGWTALCGGGHQRPRRDRQQRRVLRPEDPDLALHPEHAGGGWG
jgi:hypothetical protein